MIQNPIHKYFQNPSNQNSRPLAPADGIPGGTLMPILKHLEAMDGYVFFFSMMEKPCHFTIEIHSDLGILRFRKPPYV